MSNMNTGSNNGVGNNKIVSCNKVGIVTKESRNYLMSLLTVEEQKLFKDFVKQVGAK